MNEKIPQINYRRSRQRTPLVLVGEHEFYMASLIHAALADAGCQAIIATDAETTLYTWQRYNIRLLLVDYALASELPADQYRLLRRQRVPVILTTWAHLAEELLESQLLYDVDDYLGKPFSTRDLVLRVQRLLQRRGEARAAFRRDTSVGNFRLDRQRQQVIIGQSRVHLTPIEYHLLEVLMGSPNETIRKEDLVKAVWNNRFYNDENVLRVTIRRLRNKIEPDPSNPSHLVTIYGQGYKLTHLPTGE